MKLKLGKSNLAWMLLAALAVSYPGETALAQSADLPSKSIYHFDASLENQDGEFIGLDNFKGHPTLVTMFYANCPHVCPLLISTIKVTESQLTAEELQELRVLTISVDPERDTPSVLLETFRRHAVDADRWSMVRPDPIALRTIAGILGIKYKKLPDGEFNHSTRIVLLDRFGTPVTHTTKLGRHDPEFLESIKAITK